ncbi:MAG: hypothetical protein IT350_12870 [Deltaproteobacteria bacterium]|nr:hypothetical protein [Deltaproteobacteria bacterium]
MTKNDKAQARKRQERAMKKRGKDVVRHRTRSSTILSENTIQHQMLGEFGSVENFIRNMRRLGELFREDESLKTLRFDAAAIYAKLDLAEAKTNAALRDFYSNDDFTYFAEEFEEFWKERRGEILPDLVNDERANEIERIFKVLMQKKKGFKKDYRAVLAGHLLIQSHQLARNETPIAENNLWEMMFNATIKENKVELPEPRPEEPKEAETEADAVAPVDAAPDASEPPAAD